MGQGLHALQGGLVAQGLKSRLLLGYVGYIVLLQAQELGVGRGNLVGTLASIAKRIQLILFIPALLVLFAQLFEYFGIVPFSLLKGLVR
ncbi:MAG TPA: hypothetical protein DCE41_08880 [Cytophagales bacterium]|nr:hypothetical protein [Cytophagales bacterium]